MSDERMISVKPLVLEKALRDAGLVRFATDSHVVELRALLDAKPETVAGHHPACRAVDDYKPGECSHDCKTPSGAECPGDGVRPCKKFPEQGDTVGVSARWSDWSMVTLEIDGQHRTYVEACKPKQPQGEQVACMPVERCYDARAKMIIAFNEAKKAGGDLDDWLDAAYKSALRYSPTPLTAEQPAPVAVVHPFTEKVIRKLERFQECADDGQGADIGRHWFDLLTQLGLLNRVQRSPALWEMTQQGEDALKLSRQRAKSR